MSKNISTSEVRVLLAVARYRILIEPGEYSPSNSIVTVPKVGDGVIVGVGLGVLVVVTVLVGVGVGVLVGVGVGVGVGNGDESGGKHSIEISKNGF